MSGTQARIDLHSVQMGLIDATHSAEGLHDARINVDGPGGTRRPEIAEMTRSLLALADRLDLLAALVRQEYWVVKGQQRVADRSISDTFDPRLEPYL